MQGFSQAADNNKAAILAVLAEWLPHQTKLLEIGSGAGQHAIHLAAALNHVLWQPSDREIVLPALTSNIDEYGPANILGPITLDLAAHTWPAQTYNCVYAANVMHIVSSELGENLIRRAAKVLTDEGLLALYGPFKYAGDLRHRPTQTLTYGSKHVTRRVAYVMLSGSLILPPTLAFG